MDSPSGDSTPMEAKSSNISPKAFSSTLGTDKNLIVSCGDSPWAQSCAGTHSRPSPEFFASPMLIAHLAGLTNAVIAVLLAVIFFGALQDDGGGVVIRLHTSGMESIIRDPSGETTHTGTERHTPEHVLLVDHHTVVSIPTWARFTISCW